MDKIDRQHISPIPIIGLSHESDSPTTPQNKKQISGISEDYIDHGDQTYVCEICKAKLWRLEALRGKDKDKKSFSLCCGYGKVELPILKEPPQLLIDIFTGKHRNSKNFLKNIRQYNMMFAFTSMDWKVDSRYNTGGAPYVFRLHGQNHHTMGSLLPENGSAPKFSQLYIYDTENEDTNRHNALRSSKSSSSSNADVLDEEIITSIKGILDSNNV